MLQKRREKISWWLAAMIAAGVVALTAVLRLGAFGATLIPIGYGVTIVLIAMLRNLKVLWAAVICCAIMILAKNLVLLPQHQGDGISSHDWAYASVLLIDLMFIAVVSHSFIINRAGMEQREDELYSTVAQLSAREEDIARQNEELQSQTEELERQSEELRLANEELARREQMLSALLDLARALRSDMPRGETLGRICEGLARLVPHSGSAVLQKADNHVRVICHNGFHEGLESELIPYERSFAALVLERGRTGYLEDVSLRPEIAIPQPRNGPPNQAVLAAPLFVEGKVFGTLELYSAQKTSWSDEQIAMVESLAAQTSISLESAVLFDRIEDERSRLQVVLNTVPVGLGIGNAQCTDVRLNPHGARLFGLPPGINIADDLQHRFKMYKNGKLLDFEEHPISRAARSGTIVDSEEVELVVGGNKMVMLVSAAPIRERDGRITGVVKAFADITALKQLERELDLRRREAEESSSRKSRFLAAVSHDIRTPANAISLLAELIQRTSSTPELIGEVPSLAKELQGSAMLLVNLVSDVLDITRLDSGKIELQESEFPLRQLLEEECTQLAPLARQKGLQFKCNPPTDPIILRSDRVKLGRVLANLIGNAIKFTESGRVDVSAEICNGELVIHVHDTGMGIPDEMQQRIFDEFFQLRQRAGASNSGSGLGLTICKRLIDAMGGTLTLHSKVGDGSIFTVKLPSNTIASGKS